MDIAADNYSKRKYFNTLHAPSTNGIQSEHMQFSPFDTSISPENNFSYSFSMSISSEEDRQRSPAIPMDTSNHYKFTHTNSSDNNTSTDISGFTSKDSSGSMTISNPTHSHSSTDVMSCCPIISDSQENAELREFAIEVLSDLLVNSFDHSDKEQIVSNATTILGRKDSMSLRNKLLFKSTDNEEQRQFTMEVLSDFLSNSFDEYDDNTGVKVNETLPYNSSKERINTFFTPMGSVSTTSGEQLSTKTEEPATKRMFIAPTKTAAKPNHTPINMQQNIINTRMIRSAPVLPTPPPTYYLKNIPPQDIFVNLKEYLAANNINE